LGEAGVIGALPRETMRDYRGRYYAADNTTLVIVGDAKAEDAIEKAERAFAGFAGEARPPEGLDRSARWNTGARTIVDKDVREVYAATAFPAPGLADPRSVVVCDVLETALATGRASRLVRELKERRRIVTSISGAFPTHRHDSLLAVIATLEPERLDEYRAALEEELARLRDKKLPSKELRRAKRLLINAHRFSKETSTGAASVLGYYYTLTGSTGFEADYVDTVESVTAQEVLEAARTVFDPTQAVWVVLRPKSKP
jgi:predicted Zn-dependent peptidase